MRPLTRCLVQAAAYAALLSSGARAQSPAAPPEFGAHIGMALSSLSGAGADGMSSRVGYAIGAYWQKPLSGAWTFEPEVDYVRKGASVTEDVEQLGENVRVSASYNLDYLEVPLLLRFDGAKSAGGILPFAQFGPALSFNTGCSVSAQAAGASASLTCSAAGGGSPTSVDFGAIVGVGTEFMVAKRVFSATLRYDLGLRNVSTSGDPSDAAKNRSLALLVGARW